MFADQANESEASFDAGEAGGGACFVVVGMVPRICDLNALGKDHLLWDVFRRCKYNAKESMLMLFVHRERTPSSRHHPKYYGMGFTPRSFRRIRRLVDPFAWPDAEVQRMAEDKNVRVAVVDDFEAIMRPKTTPGKGTIGKMAMVKLGESLTVNPEGIGESSMHLCPIGGSIIHRLHKRSLCQGKDEPNDTRCHPCGDHG